MLSQEASQALHEVIRRAPIDKKHPEDPETTEGHDQTDEGLGPFQNAVRVPKLKLNIVGRQEYGEPNKFRESAADENREKKGLQKNAEHATRQKTPGSGSPSEKKKIGGRHDDGVGHE